MEMKSSDQFLRKWVAPRVKSSSSASMVALLVCSASQVNCDSYPGYFGCGCQTGSGDPVLVCEAKCTG